MAAGRVKHREPQLGHISGRTFQCGQIRTLAAITTSKSNAQLEKCLVRWLVGPRFRFHRQHPINSGKRQLPVPSLLLLARSLLALRNLRPWLGKCQPSFPSINRIPVMTPGYQINLLQRGNISDDIQGKLPRPRKWFGARVIQLKQLPIDVAQRLRFQPRTTFDRPAQ